MDYRSAEDYRTAKDYRSAKKVLQSVNLEVLDDHYLVCCHAKCRFALSPKTAQVTEHPKKRHSLPLHKRRDVTDALRIVRDTGVLVLADPKNAKARPDNSPADARLRNVDGFLCRECDLGIKKNELKQRIVI